MGYYEERFAITSHDVDVNNNAKISSITRIMQENANHHMRDRKPSYIDLFQEGKTFVISRFSCEILRPINQYDEGEVRTWKSGIKGATFLRSYAMYKGNDIVARAYSEWALVDRKTGKIIALKDVDLSRYDEDTPLSLSIPAKFRLPKEIVFESTRQRVVEYSDIDMNMHMNNTFYPDMLWNRVPEVLNKKPTSFAIRFKTEAPIGSEIEIFRAKSQDIICDGCGASETHYFKTLVDGNVNIEAIINATDLD